MMNWKQWWRNKIYKKSLNVKKHVNDIAGMSELSIYSQTSNISHTLVSNKAVDRSDLVEASPVGAAPTTSSFST